ncbi:gamma carbonic anhydrase family protein [Sphingomonas bacterium]|uniref:gamma carbonic anhydrase family protein n=1 Tax=Sphingomonas bacterium TaxID=1895847 RepID=UPI0026134442|nr:gamma carbonic anhydrase family protein [Sphingomonas bacterium]MDB5678154.1 gamma carbonic anhydrase family protein [Sphingomonas bacterium]
MPIYELDGKIPVIGMGVWIAPDAHVIGEVVLGDNVGVWFGTVIRGDTSLINVGDGTNVQDGTMLHSDYDVPLTIGAECTIGHHAILHGCTVGDRVLVGMGATVLNQAVIGDECVIGANALITEGKSFDAGSLIVGSPARAIKALDPNARAFLRASAAHYIENARRFAKGLKRID